MNPLLIEIHNDDGVEWGVSFTSSNPEPKDYVACKTIEDAKKLIKILGGKVIPKFNEIRMRHTRTTKGEWHKCIEKNGLFSIKTNFDLVCENLIEEDADFIAHAKQDVADLLNYIIEMEKEKMTTTQSLKGLVDDKDEISLDAIKKLVSEHRLIEMCPKAIELYIRILEEDNARLKQQNNWLFKKLT